jgi:hypothetical protein
VLAVALATLVNFAPLARALPEHAREVANLDLPPSAKACAAFYVVMWTGPTRVPRFTEAELQALLPGPQPATLSWVPCERVIPQPGQPICDPSPDEECSCGMGRGRRVVVQAMPALTQFQHAVQLLLSQKYDGAVATALEPKTWNPLYSAEMLLAKLRALRQNPRACR